MNPIFIILSVIAIVTTLKPKETAEFPAEKKYMGAMGVKSASDEKDEGEFLPFDKEYSLSFKKEITFVPPHLDDFDDVLKNAAQVLGFPVYDKSPYELFDEDSFSAFF